MKYEQIPKKGLEGLSTHWHEDLPAAFHLESSSNAIRVFKYLRPAGSSESMKMHHFSKQPVRRLKIKSSPLPDYVKKDE